MRISAMNDSGCPSHSAENETMRSWSVEAAVQRLARKYVGCTLWSLISVSFRYFVGFRCCVGELHFV